MPDKDKASRLAKEGFDLWQSGNLEEAVHRYQEALGFADPDHYGTPDYHAEFAGVLAALGRDDEAREQYERSLAETLRHDYGENTVGVSIARYFLGEQLLKMHEPEAALATVIPSLGQSQHVWTLLIIQAEALWQLGRRDESRRAAEEAIETAQSDDKREVVRERLKIILNDPTAE